MAGTYWLTILPDTSKLKPAIEAATRGQKITADFGIEDSQARKAGRDAAKIAETEANKAKPKVKPTADTAASKRAGQDAAEEAAKPVEQKRPKVRPAPDLPGSRKAGEEAGESAAGGMLGSLKRLGPMLAGLGLAGGLQSSLSEGMNFTEQLNVMGGVLGKTAAEMTVVSDKARQLGQDATLPGVSATTAATAMTELAKGGFNAAEAMEAVRGTLQLAGAAGIDAAEAATIQSDALNTFQLQSTEAQRVADLLTNAANASTVEIPQMSQALAQAGSAAAGFGIGIEDTLTSLAMFANFGIKGSDAGTLMKTSLLAITDGGKPATEAMNALGLELYNAQGQFVGYPKMLEQVAAASKRMTEEQFQGATAVLFGSDAMRGAMIAANGGAEAFQKTSDLVVKGAGAAAMAEARMRGLPGAWANFKNTIDGVKMTIYDAIDGPMTGLLNILSKIPEFVSRNSTAFKIAAGVITTLLVPALIAWTIAQARALATSIAGSIAGLIASWTTMAGAIMSAAAAAGTYAIAIARGVAASIIAGLTTMVAAFRNLAIGTRLAAAAQAALNLVLMANPIGLVIAAVVAIGAALWAFFTKTETGRQMWDKIWKSIKSVTSTVFEWLKEALATVGDKISWLWDKAKAGFEGIKNAVETMWNGAKAVWDGFLDIIGRVGDKVTAFKDTLVGAFNTVKDTVVAVWDRIGGIFDKIRDGLGAVGGVLSGAGNVIVNTLGLDGNAQGGRISGPGSGTSDSILARLSNGEYVVNAASTAKYLPLLEAINSPGFAAGGLAASGKAAEGGLQGNSVLVARLLAHMFPQIGTIGGFRADGGGVADHPDGRALDVMIPSYQSETGIGLGNAITAFLMKNADKLNIDYTIWRQTYRNASGASNVMQSYGNDTQDHYDHVHATMKAGSPASYAVPAGLKLPGGLTNAMDGQGIGSVGGSLSASGTGLTTFRAATGSELSASGKKVDSAGNAVTQSQQRVDDLTYDRDKAQRRIDELSAEGKSTADAEEQLRRKTRELADANEKLAENRDKLAAAEEADAKLRSDGKEVEARASSVGDLGVSDSVAGAAMGQGQKSGPDTNSLGGMFVSGLLESVGLDGSLFSNPLEWPSIKSLMAGVNWAGGLLSIAGATPEGMGAAGGGGTAGGFAAGAADAVGLGGLLSAIPSATEMASRSGSPVLAPGEFNPAVAGGTSVGSTPGMSTFAPAPHSGGGGAPGPAVDNSININGPVGMDPNALQTKLRSEQAARTRTTKVH